MVPADPTDMYSLICRCTRPIHSVVDDMLERDNFEAGTPTF